MGGQQDGIFLAGSLPHEFIILIVTLFICLWLINFSLSLYLSLSLSLLPLPVSAPLTGYRSISADARVTSSDQRLTFRSGKRESTQTCYNRLFLTELLKKIKCHRFLWHTMYNIVLCIHYLLRFRSWKPVYAYHVRFQLRLYLFIISLMLLALTA